MYEKLYNLWMNFMQKKKKKKKSHKFCVDTIWVFLVTFFTLNFILSCFPFPFQVFGFVTFEFLIFVTIWDFEFCHNLSFLSFVKILIVKIWFFDFSEILWFFVIIWFFSSVLSHFEHSCCYILIFLVVNI